jgi:SRSO17 transposase
MRGARAASRLYSAVPVRSQPVSVLNRADVSLQARQYMQGLLQAGDRKNLERMQEMIPDSDYQSLQQFISDSPWDAQECCHARI